MGSDRRVHQIWGQREGTGTPYKRLHGRPQDLRPKMRAIDVTAKTMHERLMLVPGGAEMCLFVIMPYLSSCLFVIMPSAPTPPPFHIAVNSRNTQS